MTTGVPRPELAPAYEALRAHATGLRSPSPPHGLVILLRSGVAAWITAWESMVALPRLPTPPRTVPLPVEGTGALVCVLAEMAMGSLRGGQR